MNPFDSKTNLSRRRLLAHSAKVSLLAGSLAAPEAWASALTAPTFGPERKLRLINAHTWEKLDVVYWSNGYYNYEALQQINYLMRDHRANKQIDIDKQLIDEKVCIWKAGQSIFKSAGIVLNRYAMRH